ncbi:hypothetical protein PoB_007051000 [Plakobranchus ocellatus]|uniref:Uncharacterized protein n=1 Tax=Plakobranchus ocellatus TaxID=259542 RepID=A0AAV4DIP0_9GAST|nr:hypothetical protein PoB_007051000 [Plakobranchus ocellatus]
MQIAAAVRLLKINTANFKDVDIKMALPICKSDKRPGLIGGSRRGDGKRLLLAGADPVTPTGSTLTSCNSHAFPAIATGNACYYCIAISLDS